jgi:hypothetical protein
MTMQIALGGVNFLKVTTTMMVKKKTRLNAVHLVGTYKYSHHHPLFHRNANMVRNPIVNPKFSCIPHKLIFHFFLWKADTIEPSENQPKTVMYILAMLLALESQKPQAKCAMKTAFIQLNTDELWSTIEAQMLKNSAALKPKHLDFQNYNATFYISCVLPKPGTALANKTNYDFLVQCAVKIKGNDLTMNVIITEHGESSTEKKNIEAEDSLQQKKKTSNTFYTICYIDIHSLLSERAYDSFRKHNKKHTYKRVTQGVAMHQAQIVVNMCWISLLHQCQNR